MLNVHQNSVQTTHVLTAQLHHVLNVTINKQMILSIQTKQNRHALATTVHKASREQLQPINLA